MPVGSNKLPFKCTVCAVSFLSIALLLAHKANHGDLRKDGKLKVSVTPVVEFCGRESTGSRF